MNITIDGRVITFNQPVTGYEIVKRANELDVNNVIGLLVNNEPKLLSTVIDDDCTIAGITTNDDKAWVMVNASAALVCSKALLRLNPDLVIAQTGLYEDGYFVDFLIKPTFKLDQLPDLKKEMTKIIKNNVSIVNYNPVVKDMNEFTLWLHKNKPELPFYKLDSIPVIGSDIIPSPIKFIKGNSILNLAGAYWRDDSEQPMLQRIYGTAHYDQELLHQFLEVLQDRKDRDHRKIGKELEIFTFDNLVGQGLPIWLPNGVALKQEIQRYIYDKEWDYDFIQVETPVLGTEEMYHVSGHWEHYRDDMFAPMKMGNESLVLRPMTCPHHIAVYCHKPRSYRDLPLRLAEHAILHRYEASGALTGLERVRTMQLTDSHIFVRPDQIKSEFKRCFELIKEVLKDFNITIDYYSLSLRDPNNKEKYYNDEKMWNHAEQMLKEALDELDIEYKTMIGEAAFYGPKLDIQIRTALNHEITVSTLQFDFLLPERFNLEYIDDKNNKVRPIIIHRGLIGTYERFISVLLEQTKGKLPLWLSPTQLVIIPVSNEHHLAYATKLKDVFKKMHLRVKLDAREERLSYKIRESQVMKIPYQIVIGNQEVSEEKITYREYGSQEQVTLTIAEFIKLIENRIGTKK